MRTQGGDDGAALLPEGSVGAASSLDLHPPLTIPAHTGAGAHSSSGGGGHGTSSDGVAVGGSSASSLDPGAAPWQQRGGLGAAEAAADGLGSPLLSPAHHWAARMDQMQRRLVAMQHMASEMEQSLSGAAGTASGGGGGASGVSELGGSEVAVVSLGGVGVLGVKADAQEGMGGDGYEEGEEGAVGPALLLLAPHAVGGSGVPGALGAQQQHAARDGTWGSPGVAALESTGQVRGERKGTARAAFASLCVGAR